MTMHRLEPPLACSVNLCLVRLSKASTAVFMSSSSAPASSSSPFTSTAASLAISSTLSEKCCSHFNTCSLRREKHTTRYFEPDVCIGVGFDPQLSSLNKKISALETVIDGFAADSSEWTQDRPRWSTAAVRIARSRAWLNGYLVLDSDVLGDIVTAAAAATAGFSCPAMGTLCLHASMPLPHSHSHSHSHRTTLFLSRSRHTLRRRADFAAAAEKGRKAWRLEGLCGSDVGTRFVSWKASETPPLARRLDPRWSKVPGPNSARARVHEARGPESSMFQLACMYVCMSMSFSCLPLMRSEMRSEFCFARVSGRKCCKNILSEYAWRDSNVRT